MVTKAEIRKEILTKRQRVPQLVLETKSGIIRKRLLETEAWQRAKAVWPYVSLPGEVSTFQLIELAWKEGKQVAVPKVTEAGLVFSTLTSFDELEEGHFHVLEPVVLHPVEDEEALIILPGVAFDEACNRVGYGKGYYDRYLEAHPGHPTAALAYECSVCPHVPTEETDRKADLIVTEARILFADGRNEGRESGADLKRISG